MWNEASAYGLSLQDEVPLALVGSDGWSLPLEISRWLADADDADGSVLDRCAEPVLDIGCGPGRMVRACYDRDIAALGVDVAYDAVEIANARGGPALHCDVFDEVPAAGTWSTILLLDGNVGIGGDVARLLARAAYLLAGGGQVIAETAAGCAEERRMRVRFRRDGVPHGASFGWSVVSTAALVREAHRAGLVVVEQWTEGGRHFVRLAR